MLKKLPLLLLLISLVGCSAGKAIVECSKATWRDAIEATKACAAVQASEVLKPSN